MDKYYVSIHKGRGVNASLEEELAYELMFFYRNNGILKDPELFIFCFDWLQGILKSFRKDFVESGNFKPIVEDPRLTDLIKRLEREHGEQHGAN